MIWLPLALNLFGYGITGILMYGLWRKAQRATTPYSLLRIHVSELMQERAPNDHRVVIPVYVAVPTIVHPEDPCSWVYFDLDLTGRDVHTIRRLMADPPITDGWLYVRIANGVGDYPKLARETWPDCS